MENTFSFYAYLGKDLERRQLLTVIIPRWWKDGSRTKLHRTSGKSKIVFNLEKKKPWRIASWFPCSRWVELYCLPWPQPTLVPPMKGGHCHSTCPLPRSHTSCTQSSPTCFEMECLWDWIYVVSWILRFLFQLPDGRSPSCCMWHWAVDINVSTRVTWGALLWRI